MRQITIPTLAAAALAFSTCANAQELTFLSENYHPFNWEDDAGVHGISVDILGEIFSRTGYPATIDDIEFLPWARAYTMTVEQAGTVLFATTRTEAREDLFTWVGPITQMHISVIAHADTAATINSVDDLANLTIGTVRNDVGEQLLVDAGLDMETFEQSSDVVTSARKLASGRVDAIAVDLAVLLSTLAEMGMDSSDYVNAFDLFQGDLYYAFNPDVDEATINSFQAAIDEIHADGTADEIIAGYLE